MSKHEELMAVCLTFCHNTCQFLPTLKCAVVTTSLARYTCAFNALSQVCCNKASFMDTSKAGLSENASVGELEPVHNSAIKSELAVVPCALDIEQSQRTNFIYTSNCKDNHQGIFTKSQESIHPCAFIFTAVNNTPNFRTMWKI